jgi:hypothetical protein
VHEQSSPLEGYGFNTGLTLDCLFKKTNTSKLYPSANFSSDVRNNSIHDSVMDSDFETLKRINIQWNEYYSPDLSCNMTTDHRKDSRLKIFT